MYRSSVGFEFRTVGANPDAAKYAGMNVVWLTVAVMATSGALAGLAGANQIIGLPPYQGSTAFSAGIGFDAIALALLGRSRPVGVVWAGLLFGALTAGGRQMQGAERIPIDLVEVIQALIIVFIAAPALVRAIYRIKTDTMKEPARSRRGGRHDQRRHRSSTNRPRSGPHRRRSERGSSAASTSPWPSSCSSLSPSTTTPRWTPRSSWPCRAIDSNDSTGHSTPDHVDHRRRDPRRSSASSSSCGDSADGRTPCSAARWCCSCSRSSVGPPPGSRSASSACSPRWWCCRCPSPTGGLTGLMCERVAVINIGIEGQLLSAAFVGHHRRFHRRQVDRTVRGDGDRCTARRRARRAGDQVPRRPDHRRRRHQHLRTRD